MASLEIPGASTPNAHNDQTNLHPLSPSVHPPRRSASFTAPLPVPSSSGSTSLPLSSGYFDLPTSGSGSISNGEGSTPRQKRRNHAASISTLPRHYGPKGRVSQADLLGVGVGLGSSRRPRSLYEVPVPEQLAQEGEDDTSPLRDETTDLARIHSRKGRLSIGDANGKGRAVYVDSLSKEDAAVLEMRFELMSDQELGIYLSTLFPLPVPGPGGSSGSSSVRHGGKSGEASPGIVRGVGETAGVDEEMEEEAIAETPRPVETKLKRISMPVRRVTTNIRSSQADGGEEDDEDEDGDKTPLFPPSPPGRPSNGTGGYPDHPLRILARAVQEMKERMEVLEEENERLRFEVSLGMARQSQDKPADQVSRTLSRPSTGTTKKWARG